MGRTTVSKNKQGYGYKYTDLSAIHSYLESINMRYYQYIEPCGEHDYIYTVPLQVNEDGTIEKEFPPRRGCRIIQATLSGKANPAQENGSAITYARRYSLLMAFGLATDDNDAANQEVPKKSENTATTKIRKDTPEEAKLNKEMAESVDKDLVPHGEGMTAQRVKRVMSELERTGVSIETIFNTYEVHDLKEFSEEQYISCINRLMKSKDKA